MNSQDGRAGWSESRDVNLTRRALIRAGWIIPAVLVVSLPSKAFAEYSGPQFPADSEAGSLTIGTGGGQGGNSQSSGAQGSGRRLFLRERKRKRVHPAKRRHRRKWFPAGAALNGSRPEGEPACPLTRRQPGRPGGTGPRSTDSTTKCCSLSPAVPGWVWQLTTGITKA